MGERGAGGRGGCELPFPRHPHFPCSPPFVRLVSLFLVLLGCSMPDPPPKALHCCRAHPHHVPVSYSPYMPHDLPQHGIPTIVATAPKGHGTRTLTAHESAEVIRPLTARAAAAEPIHGLQVSLPLRPALVHVAVRNHDGLPGGNGPRAAHHNNRTCTRSGGTPPMASFSCCCQTVS